MSRTETAGAELATSEPTQTLATQIRRDEDLAWVVRMDKKDLFLSAVASAVGTLPAGVFFGAVGAVAGLALTGGNERLAAAGFAVGLLVLPALVLLSGLVKIATTTYEYAATDERFVKHVASPFGETTESVQVDAVRDAELSKDFTDKLFGNGDVKIEGDYGKDTVVFDNAPDGAAVLRSVRDHAEFASGEPTE